jgi:hypothetical protein
VAHRARHVDDDGGGALGLVAHPKTPKPQLWN